MSDFCSAFNFLLSMFHYILQKICPHFIQHQSVEKVVHTVLHTICYNKFLLTGLQTNFFDKYYVFSEDFSNTILKLTQTIFFVLRTSSVTEI